MALRVLKFGGTSVETPAHILAVARRILAAREAGDPVVVVVSAMGQTTDDLLRLARQVARTPSRRELDMLLTAGERISMTLLAMCLESLGCPAISFTGSQSGIVTDSRHTDARIDSIRCFRIEEELARDRVVIVAGFQGVSREKEVTTLGRGGSDTSAVALAVRLGAPCCEIFTDVPGVLSADPRIVPGARPLEAIGYDPMITLSHLGGRVLFRRAVLLARKYGMPIDVKATSGRDGGTRIPSATASASPSVTGNHREAPGDPPPSAPRENQTMETDRILAVALESPVHWVRVLLPAPAAGSAGAPAETLMQVATSPETGSPTLLAYSASRLPSGERFVQFAATADGIEAWLDPERWGSGARIEVEERAALVSLVGEGVMANGDVARRAAASLAAIGVPVWAIHTATLSLSLVVPEAEAERATRALHADLVEV